jgi:hypothetical protein
MKRTFTLLALMLFMLMCASTALAQIQISADDTLGFKRQLVGGSPVPIVQQLTDSIIKVPIYMYNDSDVSALSIVYRFEPNVLSPIFLNDPGFDDSLSVDPTLDSADWLWSIRTELAPILITYVDTTTYDPILQQNKPAAIVGSPYEFGNPNTAIFQLLPGLDISGRYPRVQFNIPYDVGKDIGQSHKKVLIAHQYYRVKGTLNQISVLAPLFEDPGSFRRTELAQEWFTGTFTDSLGNPIDSSLAVIPTFDTSYFRVDTPGVVVEPPPNENENDPPVLSAISPSVYSIKQGEQVSFTVSATDAEMGELRIYANRSSSLPPNANLAPTNPIIGAGGSATGTFSFKPDITQFGGFSFIFEAQDDSGDFSAQQAVTVTVEELEVDRLFTSSAEGLKPEGGPPGFDGVLVPINVVTKKIVYGIQFDLKYDDTMIRLDSVITSDRVPGWVIYDNVGQTPGSLRVVTFGLANDSMVAGSTSAVLYLGFTVDSLAQPGKYDLEIFNAWESIDPDPGVPSLEMVAESGIFQVDKFGDVNLDTRIDVADLVNVVGYIVENFTLSRRQFATADVTADSSVNVVDLIGIVNMIFGFPVSPTPVAPQEDQFATLYFAHGDIPGGIETDLSLNAEMPVDAAGVELVIEYNPYKLEMHPPQLVSGLNNFELRTNSVRNGRMKVLLYSRSPWDPTTQIRSGLSEIVRVPISTMSTIPAGDDQFIKITKAYVSTSAAKEIPVDGLSTGGALPERFTLYQNYPNPFNPKTTIEFYIDGSQSVEMVHTKLEVFNILGQEVTTLIDEPLGPGLYEVSWDGTNASGDRTASGVYLYRLKYGDAVQAKKMVLLK